ncbi:hypothetical protein NSZ01_05150 [Nocardioides szechwanensis]|nr:hypothetical protein NSZ01_05150 [Nocardioides szechwanensis]
MLDLDLGTTWMPSTEAALLLGLSVSGLRSRRKREGAAHPRYLVAGSACFYHAGEFAKYAERWRDGRCA